MPSILDEDLKDNYRALRLERGWTWEQMAEHYDVADPAGHIAPFCRDEAASDTAAEARAAVVESDEAPVERSEPAEDAVTA